MNFLYVKNEPLILLNSSLLGLSCKGIVKIERIFYRSNFTIYRIDVNFHFWSQKKSQNNL